MTKKEQNVFQTYMYINMHVPSSCLYLVSVGSSPNISNMPNLAIIELQIFQTSFSNLLNSWKTRPMCIVYYNFTKFHQNQRKNKKRFIQSVTFKNYTNCVVQKFCTCRSSEPIVQTNTNLVVYFITHMHGMYISVSQTKQQVSSTST